MNRTIIPPFEPKEHKPVRPPMVYVERKFIWVYKLVVRDFDKEGPLNEEELNALSA